MNYHAELKPTDYNVIAKTDKSNFSLDSGYFLY